MKHSLAVLFALVGSIASIAQVHPSGGAREKPLVPGATVQITWEDPGFTDNIDVELWNGDLQIATSLARAIPNSQRSYTWHIPRDQRPGIHYRFVIRSSVTPQRARFSPSFVTIGNPAALLSSSTAEAHTNHGCSVTPTPAHDQIRIGWEPGTVSSVSIVDINGNSVKHTDLPAASSTRTLDIRDIGIGSYAVTFHSGSGPIVTLPLMVMR